MRIGIIDADLIGRKKHRFPNLVCEKISAYWKNRGAEVELKLDYINLNDYDRVYVAKVFTDTPVPNDLVETDKIRLGGTGFYFDQAINLEYEVEHQMPDYHLYDSWIESEVKKCMLKAEAEGKEYNIHKYRQQFKEYTDYSIGFLTRGCFRKCPFCVNKKYDNVFLNSPLNEFYNLDRKKICLLDDNVLGSTQWRSLLKELDSTGRPFKFKQGMDERLLTEEKCEMLFNMKYDGDYTFAFDNIEDYDLIKDKLQMIRRYSNRKNIKFYVLTGFSSVDAIDIENAFKRISLLQEYQCIPYLMRYQDINETPWKNSKYRELYITIARWCNQPSIFKKMSFREFCEANQDRIKTEGMLCSSLRAMIEFEQEYPHIAKKYFNLKFEN